MVLTVVMAVSLSSCGQSNQMPNTTAADTATVNAINEAQAVTHCRGGNSGFYGGDY